MPETTTFPRVHRTIHDLTPTWPDHWWKVELGRSRCGCIAPVGAVCPHDLAVDRVADILTREEEAELGVPPIGDPGRRQAVRDVAWATQAPPNPPPRVLAMTPLGPVSPDRPSPPVARPVAPRRPRPRPQE